MPDEPEKVSAGESITLRFRAGGEDHEVQYDVLPSCGNTTPNSGHWACTEHKEGCLDDWGRHFLEGAREKGCRAVWVCHEHGPEVP